MYRGQISPHGAVEGAGAEAYMSPMLEEERRQMLLRELMFSMGEDRPY